MLGQKIGNYTVSACIGQGGMGVVYEAKHSLLNKRVAVKVLLPAYSNDDEVVSRFFNEAKATSIVDHPGIVELYDFGHLDDGRAYIVMEFLQGESLATRLERIRRMDHMAAIDIVRRVAGILSAAHQHGIVHRDLKPENLFLVPDPGIDSGERPKVLDFGIAKLSSDGGLSADAVKTGTGVIIGSPRYMSPEQCLGEGKVDSRADIYSLGCILFELLTGSPPFVGKGSGQVIAAHIHVPPPDPRELEHSIPAELAEVVLASLVKDPDQRIQSMSDFAILLRNVGRSLGKRPNTQPDDYPDRIETTKVDPEVMDQSLALMERNRRTVALAEPPQGIAQPSQGSAPYQHLSSSPGFPGIAPNSGTPHPGTPNPGQYASPSNSSIPAGPNLPAPYAVPAGRGGAGSSDSIPYGAPRSPSVSTLGSAAMSQRINPQVFAPKPKNRLLYGGVLGGIVAVGALIAMVSSSDSTEESPQTAAAQGDTADKATGADDRDALPEKNPDEVEPTSGELGEGTGEGTGEGRGEGTGSETEPELGDSDPTPPVVPVEDPKVRFVIESVPSGARVFQAGKSLGRTPFEIDVDKGEDKLQYTLRLDGYQEEDLTLVADKNRNSKSRLSKMESLVDKGANKAADKRAQELREQREKRERLKRERRERERREREKREREKQVKAGDGSLDPFNK